jgi:hypothetical protein
MLFTTLSEELEHIKQCKSYANMPDEVETKSCWQCDSIESKCDMTKWMFSSDLKAHWYCNKCMKEQKE